MVTTFPPSNHGTRFCLHTFGNGTSQSKCSANNLSQTFSLKFQKSFNLHFKHCSNTRCFILDPMVCHLTYHEVLAYRERFLCYGNPIHNFSISFTYVWNTPYLQEYQLDRKNITTLCGHRNLLPVS